MQPALRCRAVCCLAIWGLLCLAVPGHAAPVFYHDRALFTAALGGSTPSTDGYETYAFGDIPPGGRRGDFLYQFDPTVVQPAVVSDGAGGKALGGAPFDVFVGGDAVTLAYTPLVLGPGLIAFGADYFYAPSGPDIPADTYRLGLVDGMAAGQFVGNAAGLDLAGGAFFLGVIVDPASVFTQVSLFSVQMDASFLVPAYQVDSLIHPAAVPVGTAVPEPATIWLLVLGMAIAVLSQALAHRGRLAKSPRGEVHHN